MIWILHVCSQSKHTQQRSAAKFLNQLAEQKRAADPGVTIRFDQISSKKELYDCVAEIQKQQTPVMEWHVSGFAGVYGPLLGSSAWPEQISAYEWKTLDIPFAPQAQGWFYMNHAALWLAPFLATRYEITCYGWKIWRGSIRESGAHQSFPAGVWKETAGYDPIAPLYAETFSDITVRKDEWRWIYKKVSKLSPQKILDIGCGNGALLNRLAPLIRAGVGADISREAVDIATDQNSQIHNLSFVVLDGPRLPFTDGYFDLVISMLSFRYLDWDPMLVEINRVLAPGGHLLIVDMASSPLYGWECPMLIKDKLRNWWFLNRHPKYQSALNRLVTHPDWKKMLTRHPMREQQEFVCYLKSRFPHGKMKVLNTGLRAKIIAFDSGPVNKTGANSHEPV